MEKTTLNHQIKQAFHQYSFAENLTLENIQIDLFCAQLGIAILYQPYPDSIELERLLHALETKLMAYPIFIPINQETFSIKEIIETIKLTAHLE